MAKSKQEFRLIFHSWFVPAIHAVLWMLAIVCSNLLEGYKTDSAVNQKLLQLIPIIIVFLFELALSIFDVFCSRTSAYINISFLRFVAIFVFLLGITVIPLFIFSICGTTIFYVIALITALILKYMEMWLINNFNRYPMSKKENALGATLNVGAIMEGYNADSANNE